MTKGHQETYRDLVSVDVGIEDDIGIFGNLMSNVLEAQTKPEREMSPDYNRKDDRKRSNN